MFQESKTLGKKETADEVSDGVIWGVVVGMHGGHEKLAQESLANGDVTAIRHPKDPSRLSAACLTSLAHCLVVCACRSLCSQ